MHTEGSAFASFYCYRVYHTLAAEGEGLLHSYKLKIIITITFSASVALIRLAADVIGRALESRTEFLFHDVF